MLNALKFVHCADIHLDAPFSERSGEYSEARRKDIRNAFMNILNFVKEENADLLLISGDLYEHRYITRKTMDWLHMVLAGVRVPVVIIPGNHDPYLVNSWYKNWDWPSNVNLLSPEHPYLVLEDKQVSLYGLGFSAFKEGKPDLSAVKPPQQGYFNILMLHGTLDMDFTGEAYKPLTSEELAGLGYDYYALGHFHNMRTDYPLKNAANPGSPEPLGFDEPGVHGAFFVTLTAENKEVKAEIRRFDTAIRVYHEKTLDITGSRNLEEVKIRILGLIEGMNPRRDLVRIVLKGRTDLGIEPRILEEAYAEDWLYLKIKDETQKAFDMESLQKEPSLRGAFVREIMGRIRLLEENMGKSPPDKGLGQQKQQLELALVFGLEALQDGKIEWWDEI